MACSDYISPSTEQFVAKGSSGSEVGSYESVIDITLPDGVSRGVLAVNLYDVFSGKYEAFTIVVPQGLCSNTNCVVLTKNINKKINIFLLFNNLIKGNTYILNYCFYYNPDIIIGTEATPQPTQTATPVIPTSTPIPPTATVDPSLPTSTPTNTPLPTQTTVVDFSLVVPPLLVVGQPVKAFNLNDYDVLIDFQEYKDSTWKSIVAVQTAANSEAIINTSDLSSTNFRALSIVPGYLSSYNTRTVGSGTNYNYTLAPQNDIFPPIFAGDRIYNNNPFAVYAVIERIQRQYSPNKVIFDPVDSKIIDPYSWTSAISKITVPYTKNQFGETTSYRTRFAKMSSGTAVTSWFSNTADFVLGYETKGFGPIISSETIITPPLFINNQIYNNNTFPVNIAVLKRASEISSGFSIFTTYYETNISNVSPQSFAGNFNSSQYIYDCIFFIAGACTKVVQNIQVIN